MFAKPLTVKVYDYNIVAKDPEFIRVLRMLTLNSMSGMNHELNSFQKISLSRPVDCKIITAYRENELVAWALLSGEASDFTFGRAYDGFKPDNSLMLQIYVQPQHRRQGIASELMKTASGLAGTKKLSVCPWDEASYGFYNRHKPTYEPNYL